MKNYVLATVLVFTALTSVFAVEVATTTTLSIYSNEKAILLDVKSLVSAPESITITDNDGRVVYTNKINSDRRLVKYNLENLPSGDYTIKVKGSNFIEYTNTRITNSEIQLSASNTYFRPIVTTDSDKVYVNALLTETDEIQITVLDDKGLEIFRAVQEDDIDYKKTFDLGQLASGNYNVVIITDHFVDEVAISL